MRFFKEACLILVLFTICTPLLAKKKKNRSHTENPTQSRVPFELEIFEPLLNFQSSTQGFTSCAFQEALKGNLSHSTAPSVLNDPAMRIIEGNFNAFCRKISDCSLTSLDYSIPAIVHFIWLGSPPSANVNANIESWKKHHPLWEIRVWTDKDLESFVWTTPRSKYLFENVKSWAEKADILRLEILYQFGGVYSDTDVICVKPFDDLISHGLIFFAGFEVNILTIPHIYNRLLVGNAIIGASKGSSIIRYAMDIVKTQEEMPQLDRGLLFYRTGPGPLSKACYKAILSRDKDNILILPTSYFYPLPSSKRMLHPSKIVKYIKPETFAIHLWEGSWGN